MSAFFTGVLRVCLSVLLDKQAHVAQLVERILGKDEVSSSNLLMGSIILIEVILTDRRLRR